MDPNTWGWVEKGGIIGVCLLVIWMGWQREQRTAAALEKLNEKSQEVQVKTVEALTKLTERIESRPCVSEPWDGRTERRRPDRGG